MFRSPSEPAQKNGKYRQYRPGQSRTSCESQARIRLQQDGNGRIKLIRPQSRYAPPGFGRHVVTRATRILCTDEGLDHAFVRDVQLRAADLEPFLRRTRSVTLRALGRS